MSDELLAGFTRLARTPAPDGGSLVLGVGTAHAVIDGRHHALCGVRVSVPTAMRYRWVDETYHRCADCAGAISRLLAGRPVGTRTRSLRHRPAAPLEGT